MGTTSKFLKILPIFLTVAACAPIGKSANKVAEQSLGAVGCKAAESEIWSSLQGVADEGAEYPSVEALREALMAAGRTRGFSGQKFERYVNAFLNYYQTTIEGIEGVFAPSATPDWKKALAELELGVQTTELHVELNGKIATSLAELKAAEKDLDPVCPGEPDAEPVAPEPTPVKAGTIWELLAKTENPEVGGILKTFATAYQSCDVLSLPPMNSATASVKGISIVGDHPAGGKRRAISNLNQVVATHYYVNGQRLAKNSCFEVRKAPMIYDFGGKPYTTASAPNVLNMFRDGGSGTSVLGIDCSAFVFSSLALAGLKVDPSKVMKADLVHGIGSRAFKEPQSNGLKCLNKISVTKTRSIEPGDIIAINGHVNIIDSVGADPFGLSRISSLSDCNSSKILYSNFDFVIAQSSPSKGGIGINRYAARDYLKESSTYRDGLTRYAVAACRAKFGASSTVSSPSLSVIRHKRTSDCLVKPLKSVNEECVDSCRAP